MALKIQPVCHVFGSFAVLLRNVRVAYAPFSPCSLKAQCSYGSLLAGGMAKDTVHIQCASCGNTVEADRPPNTTGGRCCECCYCGARLEIPREIGEPEADRRPSSDAPPPAPSSSTVSLPPADMPVAEPFFLPMPEDVPEQLRGIITDAVCLRCSGDRSSGLFGNADEVLAMFLQPGEFVEYDDPHWSSFRGIGTDLKRLFPAWGGECFCIFASQARGVWAVGIGNRKKNRSDAGRIALAAAAAAVSSVHNEPLPERLQSYPAFAGCLREVKRLVG